MFDLTHDIKDAGLNLTQKREHSENITIYLADYFYSNKALVAKYIFIACDSQTFITSVYKNDELISNVVERLFFELQNDLSWNLYLVCVMEIEEYKKLSFEDILKFQNNKEYTRNIILPRERFQREIPVGRIVINDSENEIQSPIEDWVSILVPDGLEFCLNSYTTQQVNDYIKGRNVAANTYQYSNNSVQISSIQLINGLQLTDKYRPSCFGKTVLLPFKYVNLLTGPNGAGKTSILQAIESVLTGEVRIGNGILSTDDISSGIHLKYNDVDKIYPPNSNQEKKSRESSWYKNRESERTKPALNNAFHIYNHFSAEDTFLFSFDDEQPDYEMYFTKMLFGEEVKTAERTWIKYKYQFSDLLKNTKLHKEELKEQLEELNNIEKISKEELIQRMDVLGVKYNPAEPVSTWQKQVITIQSYCVAANDLPEIIGQNQIDQMLHAWEIRDKTTQEQLEKLQIQKNELQIELNEDKKALQELFESKNTISNQKSTHQYALNQLKILKILVDNIELLEELKQLYSQQLILSREVQNLQNFFLKYQFLHELTYSYVEISTFITELPSVLEEKRVLEDSLLNLHNQLNEMELQKNALENVVSNIRSYGKTYISIVKDFKACPLCGNQKITTDELRVFLNQKFQGKDDILHQLHLKKDEVTRKRSLLEKKEKNIREFESIKNSIDIAFNQCGSQKDMYGITDPLTRVKLELDKYDKTQQSLLLLKEKYGNILAHLQTISPELASSPQINDYPRLIEDIEASIPALPINQNSSIIERLNKLINYLNGENFLWETQLPVLEIKYKEKLSCIENLEKQLNNVANYISKIEVQVNQNNNEKVILNRIQQFFTNVLSLLKDNTQEIYRLQLFNQCSVLLDRFAFFLKSEENSSRITLMRKQQNDLDIEINRIETAYNKLCQLKPSCEYAQNFILHNITRISDIFGCLHIPKEFDSLIIHDGKIAGKRNGHIVYINMMSTGQKTAVALSVFLTLNAAMKTAPQFILIDEPVANIDDLNVLSLLDFLREMVIANNKQIFFTTASYNVRRLFRRKFSFLEDDFIELGFDRIANLKSTITIKQYTQSGLLSPEHKIAFSD